MGGRKKEKEFRAFGEGKSISRQKEGGGEAEYFHP